MTEIAHSNEQQFEVVTAPSTQGLQRLRAEVEAMKDAAQMARGIAASGFVPDHWVKDKSQEQAIAGMAAAILFGAELGLSAMRSVNELFMVRGKPAMYSRTAAALVRAAGYVMEPVEETDERVVWKAYRDGAWKYSEWSMERAKQAGYTSNKLYQSNPKEMLRAKCLMELCRIAFQDVLLGMDYSVEELNLIDGVNIQRPVKKRGPAALRELAEQGPNVGDKKPPQEEQAAEPKRHTHDPKAVKAVHDAARMNGLDDPAAMLADLSQVIGMVVTSLDEVSPDELESYRLLLVGNLSDSAD